MLPQLSPAFLLLLGAFVAVIGPTWHLILRFIKKVDPAKLRKHEIAAHATVVLAALLILVGTVWATGWPRSVPIKSPGNYETPVEDFTQLAGGA